MDENPMNEQSADLSGEEKAKARSLRWREKNREELAARAKAWREANKNNPDYIAKKKAARQLYDETHREENKERDRVYREAHKDDPAYLERRRATYAGTRVRLHDKRLEQGAEYREAHRDELKEKAATFRAEHADDPAYREKRREYNKDFHAKHREERCEEQRLDYAANREKHLAKDKLYRSTSPGKELHRIIHHRQHLKSKYGMTPEQLDAMRLAQGNKCAICGDEFKLVRCEGCERPAYDKSNCCVDHDHATGEVRGLLCDKCNLGFGQMKEDPARLRLAASYLEREPELGFVSGCEICDIEFDGKIECCTDHDHATGKFRGKLCHGCNLGIGHFRDNAVLLMKAAGYAEAWRSKILKFPATGTDK